MKIQILLLLSCIVLFSNCRKDDTPPINHKQEMRQLVQEISDFAKNLESDFIIMPHNGEELVTKNGKIDSSPAEEYLAAIDAVSRDGVFFGLETLDEETTPENRVAMTQFLDFAKNRGVSIMVTDFCNTPAKMDSSYVWNLRMGYLPFVADHDALDNIPTHPSPILNENNSGVKGFGTAENFLVLVAPNYNSKQAFIDAVKGSNYDLLIMDPYYQGQTFTPYEMAQLREKENGGLRRLLAYVNIGEAQQNRFYWQPTWNEERPEWIEEEKGAGTYQIQYWSSEWKNILIHDDISYLLIVLNQGYDGIYLDGVDAFEAFE